MEIVVYKSAYQKGSQTSYAIGINSKDTDHLKRAKAKTTNDSTINNFSLPVLDRFIRISNGSNLRHSAIIIFLEILFLDKSLREERERERDREREIEKRQTEERKRENCTP
eukprot:sb/3477140/